MKHKDPKSVLAIVPSSRGFGFAILDGRQKLMDWGVRGAKGDECERSLKEIMVMVMRYLPSTILLPVLNRRASARNALFLERVKDMARDAQVKVVVLTIEEVAKAFAVGCTKHTIASEAARRYPEQLGFHLPQKRKPWMSEDYRMSMFMAVSLGIVFQMPSEVLSSMSSRKRVD